MNKREFLSALGQALSGLPEEERRSILQYYEDYFLDAEGESEEQIIKSLGQPHHIADDILREYRELQPHPAQTTGGHAARRPFVLKGMNPWLLALLVLVAIPFGVPLIIGLLGVAVGLVAAVAAMLLSVFLVLLALPAALLITGTALLGFSFTQWAMPASAVLTIGAGLVCLALGGLGAIAFVRLCQLFLPSLVQGLVTFAHWVFDRLRGVPR